MDGQIREVMVEAYEKALVEENVVRSRPERNRPLSEMTKMVMEDLLERLDRSSTDTEM